jgi:large subunit ribosomal protein L25
VKAEGSPGVKRGGAVNIVAHAIELECGVENIPQFIEADVGSLEIGHSLHLSDIKLPTGVRALTSEDATLVTIVPPSGYAEEQKAAAAAPAAGAAAPAAGAAAPAAGAAAPAAAAKAPAAKAPAGGDKKK